MKVKVIKRFADKETKEINEVGDTIEVTKERYSEIRRFVEGVKETVSERDEEENEVVEASDQAIEEVDTVKEYPFPKHTGGGWYEISNGEKVQGKENAEELESKLRS